MKRHRVELAYADSRLWARCGCGWTGTAYEVRVVGGDEAYRAAEREASGHEERAGS